MKCRNCNSSDVELFHDKVWSISNGEVYRCSNCELIYITPLMTELEEREFYKNYINHVKDRGVVFHDSIEAFHKKSQVVARERIRVIGDFFKTQRENGRKVLEVGSSTGAFLSLLADCETHACELSEDHLKYSQKFINGSTFSSLEEVSESNFDIICMFHVFEHIKNPQHFLNQCKSLLKDNGHILIEVPCSNDPLITLYDCEAFKDFVFQPMHPMVYNEKSLDFIFSKSGFCREDVIYHQRYGLDNHLSWLKNKQPGGDMFLQELFGSNEEYKQKLVQIKKTDTIFYIASKE